MNAGARRADANTAAGLLSACTPGNNLSCSQRFEPLTGHLQSQQDVPKGAVQSVDYTCDAVGNLLERHDTADGLTDSVSYDTPKRLTPASTSGTINDMVEFGYDAPGNLACKNNKIHRLP